MSYHRKQQIAMLCYQSQSQHQHLHLSESVALQFYRVLKEGNVRRYVCLCVCVIKLMLTILE